MSCSITYTIKLTVPFQKCREKLGLQYSPCEIQYVMIQTSHKQNSVFSIAIHLSFAGFLTLGNFRALMLAGYD